MRQIENELRKTAQKSYFQLVAALSLEARRIRQDEIK